MGLNFENLYGCNSIGFTGSDIGRPPKSMASGVGGGRVIGANMSELVTVIASTRVLGIGARSSGMATYMLFIADFLKAAASLETAVRV
jgi:hypothetical protein